VLIGPRTAITAGHCVEGGWGIKVRMGMRSRNGMDNEELDKCVFESHVVQVIQRYDYVGLDLSYTRYNADI
jgi:V8-like Glu-specific endopeptidase